MTDTPLVCVCLPSYISGKTISGTISSILAQNYPNIRVILSDNASTDDTVSIVKRISCGDPRVKISVNRENVGGENNYTKCIQLSEGEFTAIYHADDLYSSEIISKSVAYFQAYPEVGAIFTGAYDIDVFGSIIGRRKIPSRFCDGRPHEFNEIFSEVLKRGNFMIFPSAMVRTSIYKNEILAWNGEMFRTSADLDVWLRIAEKHLIGFLPLPLMKYRVSQASYSYTYSRLRVERHDLFLVLAHYLAKYSQLITGTSLNDDYRLLLLKDDINIAINLLIRGEPIAARERLQGIFLWNNVVASRCTLVQMKIILLGYLAWTISLLPISAIGRKMVAWVRHKG